MTNLTLQSRAPVALRPLSAALGLLTMVVTSCTTQADEKTEPVLVSPAAKTAWKFSFGAAADGAILVAPETKYTPATGYGFEPIGAQAQANAGGVWAEKPFLFSAAVPEGNYRVKVVLGDKTGPSNVTVKAEAKRLMLESVAVEAGQTATREFSVNIRSVKIAGGGNVSLKPREEARPHWDDKLTLEFNGTRPAVSSIEIAPETGTAMIFLAGDSTVTDQNGEPFAAWGQMLSRFLKPGLPVANYAESGLTLGSFRAQNRLKKILSLANADDWVFVQFGHNDQKEKGDDKGPFKSYKSNLLDYVKQIRATGATPVLLSPMERRSYSGGKFSPTLADYAEAVRQVAGEEKVAFIDLNTESLKFYRALGGDGSKKAFVFAAAGEFPGRSEAIKDNTHFSNYGAYEIARIVVEGIKTGVPALAAQLAEDVAPFDPSKPDSPETFGVPLSAFQTGEKPAGS